MSKPQYESSDVEDVQPGHHLSNTVTASDAHTVTRFGMTIAPRQRWYHWHEDGVSKAEKLVIFKLDFFILLYICLSFFVKYLEQTSVTNAWISGMHQELRLAPDDLNWLTTYYNIGIIIGSPLTVLAMTYVRPMYFLPTCTLISSAFVVAMYRAADAPTLYGLRFCVGFFASSIQPAGYYLIGTWYRKSELARRSALFNVASYVGVMISGPIQSGLDTHLDGHNGIAGWQWLFIVNAIISLPIALFGALCCPNEPQTGKRWWMTAEEECIAVRRMQDEDRLPDKELENSRNLVMRLLSSWQFWVFPIGAGLKELTAGTEMYRWMALYLTSKGYSSKDSNTIPTVVPCAMILVSVLVSVAADWSQRPDLTILAFGSLQLYGYIVFAIWSKNNGLMISTYIIAGAFYSSITPIVSAWANARSSHDRQLRAVVNGLITTVGYACETLSQQVFFKVADAPEFKQTGGYIWGTVWVAVTLIYCGFFIGFVDRRVERRHLRRR